MKAYLPASATPSSNVAAVRQQRGIQSIEVGGQLLVALVRQARPMMLRDLAREAGMSPAKAHPYLVSFGKMGLIEQDTGLGLYRLGPLALQLGLISLQQLDPVRLALPVLTDLSTRLQHTVALAVWNSAARGPVVLRIEESPAAIHVNMPHGSVLSLTDTATGRLFSAYLPEPTVRALWQAAGGSPWAGGATEREAIRARGLARAQDTPVAGISALSAAVLDHRGGIALAITVIGPSSTLDTGWDAVPAQTLRHASQQLSAQLGPMA